MNSLLLNPDPAPSGGGGGSPAAAPAAPSAPVAVPVQNLASQAVSVSASAAFPDDAPKSHMQRILEKFKPKSATPPAPPAAVPAPEPPKPAEPTPPAAVPAPEPPKPAAAPPEPPKKVTIGGKEYDVAELEKIVAGQNQQPQPPTAAPEPPKPPTEPQLTPEQIAAKQEVARQQFLKAQAADVAKFIPQLSKERLDKILSGEEGAAQELQSALSEVAAAAVYQSRDSIYAEMNPMIAEFAQAYEALAAQVKPLVEHHQTLNQFTQEQTFLKSNPDYAPFADLYRRGDELLRTQYPETNSWTKEQRDAEIKAQIDYVKNAEAEQQSGGRVKEWRAWKKILDQAAQAASQPAVPAVPATPAPAAPVAPPKPKVQPPASNLPGAVPAQAKQKSWAATVASDLANAR